MTDPARRAVLLDFGGVCLVNPVELHRAIETRLSLPAGTFTWQGPVDPSTDAQWRSMIAGELSEREYWHRRAADVGTAAGRALSLRAYMDIAYAGPEEEIIRPGARALIEAAKARGLSTGVLTNDLKAFHGAEFVARIRFLSAVDVLVDASETGILKPDPEAYRRALDALGLSAPEVLFVDDQPRNVAGARALGIPTVHFDVARPRESWRAVRAELFGPPEA